MKKLLLLLVLAFTGAVHATTTVNPKEPGPFEPDRLVVQDVGGIYIRYVLTDLKTGCQYINTGRLTLLGCSPEYISDKFKK